MIGQLDGGVHMSDELDLPAVHAAALSSTGQIVVAIPASSLDQASPCQGWSMRDLLNHVVSGNWWAAELGAGRTIAEVGDRLDGDVLGPDPTAAYETSAAAAAAVFRVEGAMDA